MPKHVERVKTRPIPGAFGLDKGRDEWECLNRANAPYLTRTGYYDDKLYIFVEEEYGYASYLWVYPGTPEELVDDWCEGRVPWNTKLYRGEFDSVYFHTMKADRDNPYPRRLELVLRSTGEVIEGFNHINDFDGDAHVHEEDDSGLRVSYYEVRGRRKPQVIVHVLDALAAIPA